MFEIAKVDGTYAGTPTTLVSFNGTNGANPFGHLIADAAGNLFGTTFVWWDERQQHQHSRSPMWGERLRQYADHARHFNGTNGANPFAGLIADAAGNLFGTTQSGGTNGDGTVFEIANVDGSYASTPTMLVSFNGTNGSTPFGGLIEDAAGNLFGTTQSGGTNDKGTVFGDRQCRRYIRQYADHTGQLQRHQWVLPFGRSDSRRRREPVRHDSVWWHERQWHSI